MTVSTSVYVGLSLAVLALAFAAESDILCPQKCNCSQPNDRSLVIDCARHEINESILLHELDSLLSGDVMRLGRVTSLQITNTLLTQVPASVCRLINLTRLNLDRNQIRRLPNNCFTNLTGLQSFSASYNRISELQDGLFDGLNSLTELSFPNNRITSIGLRVFSNPDDLVSLKTIELAYNHLRTLEPWPYIRGLHGTYDSQVYVSLHRNYIEEFTNHIRWPFKCNLHQSCAAVHIERNSIKHFTDILNGWNITSITQYLCLKHDVAYKEHCFGIDFSWSKNYYCDCRDYELRESLIRIAERHALDSVICMEPRNLFGLRANSVLADELVCELGDRCPSSCRCVYRPGNATLHVYCSSANLSSLPLELPPLPKHHIRYKLEFSNNNLRRLEDRAYFVNTSILDVSNCSISSVDLNAWRKFARMKPFFKVPVQNLHKWQLFANKESTFKVPAEIYLQNNKMESVPSEVAGINLTSVKFALHNNPWKCSCDSRWMIAWFRSLSYVSTTGGVDVMCGSPSRLRSRSITKSNEVDFCVDPATKMTNILKISLSTILSAVVVLLAAAVALYRLRFRLYKRWKFHPFDRDECVGEDMEYDVYLCCSSEDNDPHGLRVLELLESKGYRVCYHLRDFLAGAPIVDNMLQAIVHSKRTVCLISSDFLQRYTPLDLRISILYQNSYMHSFVNWVAILNRGISLL